MKKHYRVPFHIALISAAIAISAASAHADTYTLDKNYGQVPLVFTLNEGQFEPPVKFAVEGNNSNQLGTDTGTVYLLAKPYEKAAEKQAHTSSLAYRKIFLHFLGANLSPEITFDDQVSWNNNYFIGNNPEQWFTDVPNYKHILLNDIYEGIDLVLTSNNRRIDFEIIVHPNSNPLQIVLKHTDYDGIQGFTVNEQGELIGHVFVLGDPVDVTEVPPYCCQIINGKEISVDIRYRLVGEETITFQFGEYDSDYELVIRPELVDSPLWVLKRTLEISGLDVDDTGDVYVTGKSNYKRLFVLKINEVGDELGFATYFGGSGYQSISCFTTDSAGNIYIAGVPGVSNDFPITIRSFNTNYENGGNSFILKLNYQGNALEYSSFLGGTDRFGNTIGGIDVNDKGNVYIAGWTQSRDYPTTPNVMNPEYIFVEHPELDMYKSNGFITKFNIEGSDLVFSTYFDTAKINSIKVDESGIIMIAGNDADLFVAAINATASDSLFTFRYGGNDKDILTGMDIDNGGNIYVAGYTESEDFYTTDGSMYHGGTHDCFIAKVGKNRDLAWSKLIGGSGDDRIYDITIDLSENINLVGSTTSLEFPLTGDALRTDRVSGETFFTIINNDLSGFSYSTFIGSSGSDMGYKIKTYNNNIFMSGYTSSFDFPVTGGIFDVGFYTNIVTASKYIIKLTYSNSTLIETSSSGPDSYPLNVPYPNPFNETTSITYTIGEYSPVVLSVYNVNGQLIETIVNEYKNAGSYTVYFNGVGLSTGIYFCRLTTNKRKYYRKMLLIK